MPSDTFAAGRFHYNTKQCERHLEHAALLKL